MAFSQIVYILTKFLISDLRQSSPFLNFQIVLPGSARLLDTTLELLSKLHLTDFQFKVEYAD
ncbi:hypothetical protein T11_2379 [Trichinella zimbabwensis]|uniref:Uncharacterized protein n=1 Tax=Trichinella zimbabwensis TaxID=268475 RepID=A0A0V1GM49_9BILA|nr:hypothetical protein T11_2379 [Trichinella zimbabwensis]